MLPPEANARPANKNQHEPHDKKTLYNQRSSSDPFNTVEGHAVPDDTGKVKDNRHVEWLGNAKELDKITKVRKIKDVPMTC